MSHDLLIVGSGAAGVAAALEAAARGPKLRSSRAQPWGNLCQCGVRAFQGFATHR